MKTITISQVNGGFIVVAGDGGSRPVTSVATELSDVITAVAKLFNQTSEKDDDLPF